MDITTTAITIGGFFHDIGKFSERAYAVEPGPKDIVKAEYRYAHAHHTELTLLELFDEARLSMQVGPLPECTVLNLASRHHKPRNPFELIIAEADRIASGHERTKADELAAGFVTHGYERKSKVPLVSILSRIRLENAPRVDLKDWRYRITTPEGVISQSDVSLVFPVSDTEYTDEQVKVDYKRHWDNYKNTIKPDPVGGLDLFDNFLTIFELTRAYTWCLPATTRKEDMADVSLFDHMKTTAALAACLYEFHKSSHKGLNEEEIKDRSTEKFLLFSGDISGIQKFIYQISSKGAYKLLKGRSFYIQLLSEIIAREIICQFGFLATNILYVSGGKFYLLLPNTNTIKEKLRNLSQKINLELFKHFNGDLYVRTGWKPLSGYDFTRESGRTLYKIWEELTRELIYNDRRRFAESATKNYGLFFDNRKWLPNSCIVCHTSIEGSDGEKCKVCKEMEVVGQLLGEAKYIVLGPKGSIPDARYAFRVLEHYVWLLRDLPESVQNDHVVFFCLNDMGLQKVPQTYPTKKIDSALFFAGSTHRFNETFDEIAEKSKGIKRLGILRMDVDYLGKVFCEGLINYEHGCPSEDSRFYSIGRITTLSWQLSLFFSGIVPSLIRLNPDWNERVTVVYSGGDDLFILGAWDAMPEVALEIKRNFQRFVCNNPSFGLSGGIVITPGRFPIYKGAELAGVSESLAKKNVTRCNSFVIKKDSLTFLDTPMHWNEILILKEQLDKLLHIISSSKNKSLLRRLQKIYSACKICLRFRNNLNREELEDMILSERWQWLMVYSLARFFNERPEYKKDIINLQKFIAGRVGNTNRLGIELLGVLSRWCELILKQDKERRNS